PEISSQSGELETPQGATVPLVNSTSVETSVVVKDGNTIIIGGLRQEEITYDKKGFPLLMDIPLLGKLFSAESDNKAQTEIIILLTPHILQGDEAIDKATINVSTEIKPFKAY
ncbi:MAG: hypothetical protein WC214_07340, partial [Candidatus Omnitrophota bacterium]